MIPLLLLAATLAQFSPKEFYVPARQYRFCEAQGKQLKAVEDYGNYHLTFLEVHENGADWDKCQYDAIQKLIAAQHSKGTATVLVYVHGWKNHANEVDPGLEGKDVEKFRYFVQRWSNDYADPARSPVIGVYVGWHGRSLNAPGWFSWLTFWTRSIGARRAGGGDLNLRLTDLVQTATQYQSRGQERPRLLFLGHSFGARVLETAVAGDGTSTVKNLCAELQKGNNADTKIDGTFFLNAATSSGHMRHMLRTCQPKPGKMVHAPDYDAKYCAEAGHAQSRRCQPYPLLISISGKTDWTTRLVLMLASLQRPFAFLPSKQTHSIEPLAPGQAVNPTGSDEFGFESIRGARPAQFVLRRKDAEKHTNPIWAMTAPQPIIFDHGDIWNDDVYALIRGLIATLDEREAVQLKSYESKARMQKSRQKD